LTYVISKQTIPVTWMAHAFRRNKDSCAISAGCAGLAIVVYLARHTKMNKGIQMRIFLRIFFATMLVLAAFGCGKKDTKPIPPPSEPDNPIVAEIGGQQIDRYFVETSLTLTSPLMKLMYLSKSESFKKFLDHLINQEIYYLEGVKRNYHKNRRYAPMLQDAKEVTLIEFAKEKAGEKAAPVPEEEILANYDRNREHYKNDDGSIQPYEAVQGQIAKKLQAIARKKAATAQRATLENQYGVKYYKEELAAEKPALDAVVVESGVVTWTFEDFANIAVKRGLARNLTTEKGRIQALEKLMGDRLFYENAIADQLDKQIQYRSREQVLERFILANFTRSKIAGNDIKANNAETQKFYDENPKAFRTSTGDIAPFDQVKEKAHAYATARKRNEMLDQLARSLRRDSFKVIVYEENWDRLFELLSGKKATESDS
jgi:hypothetical protein